MQPSCAWTESHVCSRTSAFTGCQVLASVSTVSTLKRSPPSFLDVFALAFPIPLLCSFRIQQMSWEGNWSCIESPVLLCNLDRLSMVLSLLPWEEVQIQCWCWVQNPWCSQIKGSVHVPLSSVLASLLCVASAALWYL
jgi:hypothetical protein